MTERYKVVGGLYPSEKYIEDTVDRYHHQYSIEEACKLLNSCENQIDRLETMNHKLAKILIKQFDFTEEDICEAISCLQRELDEL